MAALMNTRNNQPLVQTIAVADTAWLRMKGLLGQKSWPMHQALWIHQCNSVHTFFMKFPIDLVFVNKHLEVKAVFRHVSPWRVIAPVWGASSVFEFAAGALQVGQVEVGDVLNVRS